MQVHNNTTLTIEEVRALPYLGITSSKWRQRDIMLYQHPTLPDAVISVGVTFDKTMQVIAAEPKSSWTTALDYIQHGKIYVSE